MQKITILSVGKVKEGWLKSALDDYTRRLASSLQLHFHCVDKDHALIKASQEARTAIGLDPAGQTMSSEIFSSFLFSQLQAGGARLTFVIGGPDGLPQILKSTLPLISLSPLTYTQQLCRLIIAEQIYRATQILSGTPYHR